jgi:hypothetical protein
MGAKEAIFTWEGLGGDFRFIAREPILVEGCICILPE